MFLKNNNFAIIFISLIAINSYANRNDVIRDTITYDVCSKIIKGPHKSILSENSLIQVNVLNANLLKYNIEINQTSFYYDSEISKEISDKLPVLGKITKDILKSKKALNELVDTFYNKYINFKNAYDVLSLVETEINGRSISKDNAINNIKSIINKGFNEKYNEPNLADLRSSISKKYREAVMATDQLLTEIKENDGIDSNTINDAAIAKIELGSFNLTSLESLSKSILKIYASLKNMDTIATKIIHCDEETDAMNIQICLIDKSNESIKHILAEYSIIINRLFRPAFSMGLAGSSLHDNSYFLVDTFYLKRQIIDGKDSSQFVEGKIAKENKNQKYQFSYGLSALYNGLWYPCNTIGLGLFIGCILTIPDLTSTQYVMGGTFAYGRRYKMCLNFGISVGNNKIISDKNMLVKPFVSDISEVPLKDNLNYGLFGSISASFSKKVKKEDS